MSAQLRLTHPRFLLAGLGLSLPLGIFLFGVLATKSARGVEANPRPFVVVQPDGKTKIRLRARGNEYQHWLETDDGYTVVRPQTRQERQATRGQPQKAYYVYVRDRQGAPGARSVGDWASQRRVGLDSPPDGALRSAPIPNTVYLQEADTPRGQSPEHITQRLPQAHQGGDRTAAHPTAPRGRAVQGVEIRNLVIPLRFSDHQNRELPTAEDLQQVFNATGGHPDHQNSQGVRSGSVKEFYLENSYGQFSLDSQVESWVDLPRTEAYYADGNSGLTFRVRELIRDGLAAWKARNDALPPDQRIDLSDFDRDGNGHIDAIAFLHSGYGAEWMRDDDFGTDYRDRIWSHRWVLAQNEPLGQGVHVRDYHISPGLWNVRGSQPTRIGVVCHETGHFFGLPDLYDTSGTAAGIGAWGLMGNSWGFEGDQLQPPHFSAYSKEFLGWVKPKRLTQPGIYQVPHAEQVPAAWRIDLSSDRQEYLLIENRQPVQFDRQIPAGSDGVAGGLAIWHIDLRQEADGNSRASYPGHAGWPDDHYMVALLQADGQYHLEKPRGADADAGNGGDGDDLYRQGDFDLLDGETVPSTKPYAQKTHQPSEDGASDDGASDDGASDEPSDNEPSDDEPSEDGASDDGAGGNWPKFSNVSAAGATMTFTYNDGTEAFSWEQGDPPEVAEGSGPLVWSAEFNGGRWENVTAHTQLAKVKIDLPVAMDVHLRADTSAISVDDDDQESNGVDQPGTIITGFHNTDEDGRATPQFRLWEASQRRVSLADNQWKYFGTTHAQRLEAGTYTLTWKVKVLQGNLTFGSGTMLIQAFPARTAEGQSPQESPEQLISKEAQSSRLWPARSEPSGGTFPQPEPLDSGETGQNHLLALVVGINRFPQFQDPQGGNRDLNGCVADAEDMTAFLENRGFQVVKLVDGQATYEGILSAMQGLLDKLDALTDQQREKAVVFVHFSTHGDRVKDRSGDEADRWDESLCTFNSGQDADNDIIDDQIYGFSQELSRRANHVVLVFDSCHSGQAARGMLKPRTPRLLTRTGVDHRSQRQFDLGNPQGEDFFSGADYVLISGCGPTQSSYEIQPEGLNSPRGALSYHLLRTLREPQRVTPTYQTLFRQIRPRIMNDARQNPEIHGPASIINTPVFGLTDWAAGEPSVSAERTAANTFKLLAGASVGVTKGSVYHIYDKNSSTFPDSELLAQVKIDQVDPLESRAVVQQIIDPDNLSEPGSEPVYPAVERLHRYDPEVARLPVYLDAGQSTTLPQPLRQLRDEIEADPVLQGHFEFKRAGYARIILATRTEGNRTWVTLSRAGESPVWEQETTGNWTFLAKRRLAQWGRWFRIKNLRNQAATLRVSLKLEPLEATRVPAREPGDPELKIYTGQQLTLTMTNDSQKTVHCYLVSVLPDGTTDALAGDPTLRYSLEPGDSHSLPVTAELQETQRSTLEGMLLVATEQKLDTIAPLLIHGRSVRSNASPLEQLLALTGLNNRPLSLVIRPGSWVTSYQEYKIVQENP